MTGRNAVSRGTYVYQATQLWVFVNITCGGKWRHIFELKTKQMTVTIKGWLSRFANSLLQHTKNGLFGLVCLSSRDLERFVCDKLPVTFVRIADPRGIEIPQDASGREVSMDTTHSPAYTEESDSEPAAQPQVGQLLGYGFCCSDVSLTPSCIKKVDKQLW